MPAYVLIVDVVGIILALIGFTMAFRQATVRRLIGRPQRRSSKLRHGDDDQDPLTYILRIAGVMIMIFGIVIGGMLTLFYLA